VPVGPPSLAQPSLAQPGPARAGLPGGIASYYWQDQMTASGERFNRRAFTAAHKTLPIGSMVRVTHETTGRAVVVRINDRGPFTPGRVIDLSEAAAEQIGMTSRGLARVRLDLVR
jgi:rare lipoprotein A